jgi:hypothetical protein
MEYWSSEKIIEPCMATVENKGEKIKLWTNFSYGF